MGPPGSLELPEPSEFPEFALRAPENYPKFFPMDKITSMIPPWPWNFGKSSPKIIPDFSMAFEFWEYSPKILLDFSHQGNPSQNFPSGFFRWKSSRKRSREIWESPQFLGCANDLIRAGN